MRHGDEDYLMRQVGPYHDNAGVSSPDPDLNRYYDDPTNTSQTGNHAPSPFHQSNTNLNNMPSDPADYQNLEGSASAPRSNAWLERSQTSSGKRSKWIVIGSFLTLAVLVAVGITLGVVLGKKNSSNSSTSGSSSSGAPPGTNPNDPSNFQKNPALVQSFYGIAYTPLGSQLPDCGNSLAEVIEDVQLMSQLTTRIRIYGADCNQSSLVLAAIQETKVNLSVYLGNYPDPTDNGTAYERQKGEIQTALQTYGADHVLGVTVGNEFILDYITQAGQTDPNGSAGQAAAAILIPFINDTRAMLSEMGLNLPVGTADAGSYFNNDVLEVVDYGMANVHPWFANVSIDDAAAWTAEFFESTDVSLAQSLTNKPNMFIAETGWPTNTSTFNYNPNDGPSLASVANLQYFIDTFVCQANQNGTGYFFFEYCDEPWKAVQYGGVEGYWGLFDSNKIFKNLTIPTCSS
ncbi:glycoside hydrolase family 17 protein [Pisolithus orientalis]|uniref:glycoside hydrolase family 17 protein n=1 Tax=Pisolithus orientalis TaxID=936130 RepID=UPI002223F79F|nr:glycoside hydrolase family 17 protein [Pisolithus orientalis]KAI6025910.1 glycoside hydrolase family 17 protein [Pisolithus orientalis]